MESSLHRELKRIYAGEAARTEVRLGRYIIDAVICDEQGCDILIEVQHGPLTAIRDKSKCCLRSIAPRREAAHCQETPLQACSQKRQEA